jgi:hypothetical protein
MKGSRAEAAESAERGKGAFGMGEPVDNGDIVENSEELVFGNKFFYFFYLP